MVASAAHVAIPRPRRSRFFTGMSMILLLIVLIGFARTFYLRAFFEVPAIPAHVYLHGAVLTAWFVWFCLQTCLVAVGRSDLHQRLGIVGAMLGAAVIVANGMLLAAIVPRLHALLYEGPFGAVVVSRALWGDFTSVIAFTVFLSSALWFRRRPEVHKRLMLLASVSIVGQALGRIAHWPAFAAIPSVSLPAGGLLFFLGALVIHDLLTTKRVHPATMIGGSVRILIWIGSAAVGASEWGQALIRAMA
jgi:hypothetical protein